MSSSTPPSAPRPAGQYGQYPDPKHVIAHLSDPHLLADSLQYGVLDTTAHLEAALEQLARVRPAPQAIVFTGDLADRGEPQAYARLRKLVEPAAAGIGAEVVWVMGNHDEREPFSEALFGAASSAPQDRVHDIAGLRIIALDTSVPGWHHGQLRPGQLAWLREQLAEPAPYGTILAMHHPPIPVPMMRVAELIELHDQAALAEAIAGSDVRAIIGGHYHFSSYSTFAGVPVSVASASCYTSALTRPDRLVSSTDADQAFTMLHLYADRVVHTVVPMRQGPEVYGEEIALEEALLGLSHEERFDLLARKDSPIYHG